MNTKTGEKIVSVILCTILIMLVTVCIYVIVLLIGSILHIPEKVYASEYTGVVDKNGGNFYDTDYYIHIKNSDATQDIYFKVYSVYNDNGETVRYGEVSVKKYSEFTGKYRKFIKNKQECKDMMEHNKSFVCKYRFGDDMMTIFIPDDEYNNITDKISNGETTVKGGSLN